MWNPATIDELVEAMELADAAQHRDAGEQAPPFPRRVVQERRASEGTLQPVSRRRFNQTLKQMLQRVAAEDKRD